MSDSNPRKSDTFCSKAFNGISISPSGGCAPCCLFERVLQKEDGTPFKIWEDDLETIYHSKVMKEIRAKMLAGEKVDGCRQCYQAEAYGGYSLRQQSNRTEPVQMKEILRGSTQLPRYIDLKLNNRCNIKCRMCQPRDSHLIFNEFKKIGKAHPEFHHYTNTLLTDPDLGIELDQVPDWARSPVFLESFKKAVPTMTKISLVGGEPLILDETYELLEMLAADGSSGNIQVAITTNLMHLPVERLAKILPRFASTLFNISLDAVEEELYYLRFPTSFEKIKANFQALRNIPGKKTLQFTPTAQVYNVLTIDKIYRFVESLLADGVELSVTPVNLKFLEFPVHLNIRILPPNVREAAVAKLTALKKDIPLLLSHYEVAANLDQLIHVLQNETITHHDYLPEFLYYSEILDRERGQSGPRAFPELFELLKNFSPRMPVESFHKTRERGWKFASEGRLEEAYQAFDLALQTSSNKDMDYREMAWIKLALGHREEALSLYERAYSLNPDDPYVLKGLALMYKSNNDTNNLNKVLPAALKRNPEDPELASISSGKN